MKRKRAFGKRKPIAKKLQNNVAVLAQNDVMNGEEEQPETYMSGPPIGTSVSGERIEENVHSMHKETITPRSGIIARDRQADLEIAEPVHGRMESYPNSLREMIVSIIKEISKETGGFASLSRSLVDNTTSNEQTVQPDVDMDFEDVSRLRQDPEYRQQELDAALAVIKKTMKLDAADPFNRPVDPVALEIPDYFDVVDTPMDFGTICNNLESGLKYMNSADVLKDVQYVWYNCLKYNKKGDHILELMKRVKTFFMKYWVAAGLHTEQSPAIVESGQQHSMHKDGWPVSPGTPVTGKILANQLQSQFNDHKTGSTSNQRRHAPECADANAGAVESCILRYNQCEKDYSPAPPADNLVHLQQKGVAENQQLQNITQEEPNIVTTNIQKKRQGRGPTRCVKLLSTVGRITVATNELGQPVGPEAPQLTSFLGLTARDGNLAPLTYRSWSKMPEEKKENMWQKVLTKFDIDPGSRSWVLMSLGTKWRNFKSLLKATRYDTHATDEERLLDRDERVLPDQWSVLVSQWSSEKWQSISAQNKANRAQQKFSHTSGKKSFARIREEERAKRPDGQEPSRAELFILTRTRKNGQPVNEATAAVISQLREKEEGYDDDDDEDAYSKVMGQNRKGGVSLYGLSAINTPSGETPSRAEALKMITEKNAEILEMKEKLASVEQTCSQMAAQMSAMVSMMATMHKIEEKSVPNLVAGTVVPTLTSASQHEQVPPRQMRGRKKTR